MLLLIKMAGRRLRSAKAKKQDIPIPSFSCVSPSTESSKETTTESTPPKETAAKPTWNSQWLLRTEGALQVQRVRRGPSKWSKEGRLHLEDFYALARQFALVETSNDKVKDPHNLSLPERLLCDLVSVASPSLYNLVEKDGMLCLQSVDFHGNRMEELRRLLSGTEMQVTKRDAILVKILEHRSSQMKLAPQVTANTPKEVHAPDKIIVEPYIRPDMTLEDRVRARAEAKQQRNTSAESKTSDRTSLLRLADAMWSHSRHIFRKQARASGTNAKRICMTLQDVVSLFAGSLLVPGTQQVHREKASRAELLQALRDLAALVPEWLSFSSPDLSTRMTVWLVPTADYASIRIKLGAPNNSCTKKLIEISHSDKRNMESSYTAKRPMEPTFTKTQEPARILSQSPSKSTLKSPTKKQRTGMAASLKRPPSDTLVSPKTKRKRGLRINKHLILTEADYDGGMILEPSLFESPRGLKRLFSQMNSGQRI